jgi:hypothetical protein
MSRFVFPSTCDCTPLCVCFVFSDEACVYIGLSTLHRPVSLTLSRIGVGLLGQIQVFAYKNGRYPCALLRCYRRNQQRGEPTGKQGGGSFPERNFLTELPAQKGKGLPGTQLCMGSGKFATVEELDDAPSA